MSVEKENNTTSITVSPIAESIMLEAMDKIKQNRKDIAELIGVIQRYSQSISELNADIATQLIQYNVAKAHFDSNQEKWLKNPKILATLVEKAKADQEVEEAMIRLHKNT